VAHHPHTVPWYLITVIQPPQHAVRFTAHQCNAYLTFIVLGYSRPGLFPSRELCQLHSQEFGNGKRLGFPGAREFPRSSHLFQAKSIIYFDDRYAESKLSKSEVWDKVPEASTFSRHLNFLTTQCRIGQKKHTCQKPARTVYPF